MIRLAMAVLLGGGILLALGAALGVKLRRAIIYDRAHDAYQRELEEGD